MLSPCYKRQKLLELAMLVNMMEVLSVRWGEGGDEMVNKIEGDSL